MIRSLLKIVLAIVAITALIFFFVLPPAADRFFNKTHKSSAANISSQARQLHSRLWVADLHADALLWRRNLMKRHSHGHVDLPRLIEGNVALQAFTVVSKVPFGLNFEENDDTSDMVKWLAVAQHWPVDTFSSLRQRAVHQAEKLEQLARDSNGTFSIIRSKSELLEYRVKRSHNPKITAGFLGLEGAHVLEGQLKNVRVLFDAGFRMMAPTHFFDTEVGGSAHGVDKGGLTALGIRVLQEMERLGMIVDLAHSSPETIDDILRLASRPVLVSHTGVKGTCNNTRNLSDQQLRGIAKTGGVIGIAYFPQATCGTTLSSIVNAIKHTVAVVGINHVALGSDFDGAVTTPFDTANLAQLTEGLLQADFSEDEIALIMGGNVRRVLLELLPE